MSIRRRAVRFIAENMMLLAILTGVSVYVLARAYFFGTSLSYDGVHYLRAAREILRGNGFYVYPEWYGIWPIGYPFLIAAAAFITRAELYLASKLLSVLFVWLIGFVLYKRFGRAAWGYALMMLNGGFLQIFCATWSEVPFLFGLILFSFWVCDILTEDGVCVSRYVKLTGAALLLFLTRYIGAFALGVIGLLWLYALVQALRLKDGASRKRILYLTASGVFTGLFILSYLLLNLKMTGYLTGSPKAPPGDLAALAKNLISAQLTEMNHVFSIMFTFNGSLPAILLWILFAAYAVRAFLKNRKAIRMRDGGILLPLVLMSVGVFYWLAIAAMRFSALLDPFGPRMLFPSTALLFLGFAGLLVRNGRVSGFLMRYAGFSPADPERPRKLLRLLPAACLSLLILSAALIPGLSDPHGYRVMRQEVLDAYADIPDGAIVLWGDVRLLYMQDRISAPYYVRPGDVDVQDFLAELEEYTGVYIHVPGMKERMNRDLKDNPELQALFEPYLNSNEKFANFLKKVCALHSFS